MATANLRISEALSDEVEAINAIYGENTLQVVSVTYSKVKTLFRLPTTTYLVDDTVFDWTKSMWTTKR